TIGGALGDGGTVNALTKIGAGTLVLTADNDLTFKSSIAINGGILSASSSKKLGDASATNTLSMDSGTLEVTGSYWLGSNRSVTIGAGGGTFKVTGANVLTVNGNLASAAATSLTKSDTGTVVLSGSNSSYVGSIAVNTGTLSFGAGSNLGDGSATNTLS